MDQIASPESYQDPRWRTGNEDRYQVDTASDKTCCVWFASAGSLGACVSADAYKQTRGQELSLTPSLIRSLILSVLFRTHWRKTWAPTKNNKGDKEEDEVRNLAFYAKLTKEDKKEQRKKMKKEGGS